ALSYFDHPPLSFWIAWAALKLTASDTVLAVRTPFILIFAGTTWLTFRFTALLFGETAGALPRFSSTSPRCLPSASGRGFSPTVRCSFACLPPASVLSALPITKDSSAHCCFERKLGFGLA